MRTNNLQLTSCHHPGFRTILVALLLTISITASADDLSDNVRDSVFYIAGNGDCCSEIRIYHPNTGDRVIAKLPGVPDNIFWSDNYRELYYKVKSTFYKLAWKRKAKPVVVIELPDPMPYAPAIWLNTKTNIWRMYYIKYDAKNKTGYEANVYDLDPKTRKWGIVAKEETEMCEGGDGSSCGAEVSDYVEDKGKLILLSDLLGSMRAWPNMEKRNLPENNDPDRKVTRFPSLYSPHAAISMPLSFGDTLHALAPVNWVGNNGTKKPLYVKSGSPCYSQIAFEESGEWVLVGTEYAMSCARLANMKSGEIVFRFPKNATNAVWVPRQKN